MFRHGFCQDAAAALAHKCSYHPTLLRLIGVMLQQAYANKIKKKVDSMVSKVLDMNIDDLFKDDQAAVSFAWIASIEALMSSVPNAEFQTVVLWHECVVSGST